MAFSDCGRVWQSTTHLQASVPSWDAVRDDGEHVGVIDMGMRDHTGLVHISHMVIATNSRWMRNTLDGVRRRMSSSQIQATGCMGNSFVS